MRQNFIRIVLSAALLIILSASAFTVKAQGSISLQEAIGIAQALYPSAQVIKTEFVNTATPPYYVIGLDNGRSVFINATTKEIIQITTSVAGVQPTVPPASAAGALISAERAAQIALQRFPNAQVRYVELDRFGGRRGVLVWEVKLTNGYEVYVNAATGDILRVYLDDSLDDRDDRGRGSSGYYDDDDDDRDDRNDRDDDDDDDDRDDRNDRDDDDDDDDGDDDD